MNRRSMISGLGAVAALSAARPALSFGTVDLARLARPVWDSWKAAYLASDGRVIDGLQRDASHSEGQGYGMVLATVFDDAASFQSMFQWTERNLAIRPDPLLAWRWLPGQANPVPDRNNASDGDLFYAWALARAAQRFENRTYLARAQEIAQALAEHCIVQRPDATDQTVFLPAAFGFTHDTHVTINPSYYMPVAMRELAAATGVSSLAICAQQGEALLAQIASEGLVPDWIEISANGVRGAQSLSPNAGYEALRVPLFMIWSRLPQHPAVQRMVAVYERTVQPGIGVPTIIEPLSGVILETSGDMGYQALAGLAMCSGGKSLGATIPPFTPDQPYYPATLQLFAMIAANETLPECVPL